MKNKKLFISILTGLCACLMSATLFTACDNAETSQPTNDSPAIESSTYEPPHVHNYTAVQTAPTCTAQGFTTYTCACGDNYIADYVNALEHDFKNYVSDNNAKCEVNGTKTATCSRQGCNETDTRTEENSALKHEFTNYVSDNNATYTSDGTKTATCNRDGCEETDTVTDTGTKLQSGITFKTLAVDGTDVYGKVSNTTQTFSFINEVTAVGTAKFVVSLDIYGIQQVATKTIPLEIGDNTVYITETVDGEPINVYTITVRRRPMYDVTFNANGGTSIEKQVIEEDFLATEPETTRMGYTLMGWDYDFTQPITEDTEIAASWTANKHTKYTVNYYLQNLENDDYTLKEVNELSGETDTTATAEIKTFEHFTHTASETESGNIAPDGSQALKVYYTRNKYTLSIDNSNGGTITNTGTYKYGTDITSTASVWLGYDFGWYHGDALLSTDLTYTFTMEQDVVAKFTVKAEMSNFNFTSTTTTCQITNVKDKTVSKIVIPDYVTSIASYAFKNCSSLTGIVIPDSVTSIGDSAFNGCGGLTEITLPFVGHSVGHSGYYTSQNLFGYIFGTSSYTGGTKTQQYASPPKGAASYPTYNYIPALLKKVTVTGGNIFYGAFYNCSNLTSVTIGDSITSIAENAFYNCSSLIEMTIPFVGATKDETIKTYFNYIFGASEQYSTGYVPASLKKVTVTGGNIFSNTFYDCSNLTSIVIGDDVTSIAENAFYNCDRLKSITVLGNNMAYKSIDGNLYSENGTTLINYAVGKVETMFTIPDSVTMIGEYAFGNCSSLTSVVIPDSVTSIDYAVFRDCSSLTSVAIGDSVTSIGSYAFYGCYSLTSVVIPDSVTSIGEWAFRDCSGLTSVAIGDSVTSIGYAAFQGCSSLTSVVIPDSVTSISSSAFAYCSSLTSVIIPDSVTSIGDYAFYYCDSLTSIEIPDSVTSIGNYVFQNCTSLTSIRFNGTKAQWNAIEKGSSWNYNLPATEVICKDGTVSI